MKQSDSNSPPWEFWVDRGGTFTDVIGRRRADNGALHITKLLSECPEQYADATSEGMRQILLAAGDTTGIDHTVEIARMGTTVGTNALLERKGDRTALITNIGFKDALVIGYQNRPDIFALEIKLPELLFETVVEIPGRVDVNGKIIEALDLDFAHTELCKLLKQGIDSLAIVFMHAYRFHEHEEKIKDLACSLGFSQVSVSHEVSPLIRFVGRGDTTVVDAYLTPLLNRYLAGITKNLPSTKKFFMQSNGGLTPAANFRGRDCLLSGPAGGVVAAAKSSILAGYTSVIGFDMGGTSTDVSHFDGRFERTLETLIGGIRVRTPMMAIHTVAAGGGSILTFDGERCRVGPHSAGANPGPACYRKGGPLTVTDANLLLGRIQPQFFPQIFGPHFNQPPDQEIVSEKFETLRAEIQQTHNVELSAEEVAEGYLRIAVEIMASAVRQISTEKGHDLTDYALCAFGGAGGQHACLMADELNINKIILHPLQGVLSAFGIGIADTVEIQQMAIEEDFSEAALQKLSGEKMQLKEKAVAALTKFGFRTNELETTYSVRLRYKGTDSTISTLLSSRDETLADFEESHKKRFGFIAPEKTITIESLQCEVLSRGESAKAGTCRLISSTAQTVQTSSTITQTQMFYGGRWHEAKIYQRHLLKVAEEILGPAIITEATATTIVDPGWNAVVDIHGNLILNKSKSAAHQKNAKPNFDLQHADPIKLELFSNRLMTIAEEMGIVLQNTSHSVNIKERLDFSCAIFDRQGRLIANAPHIPVHLGSMSESVQSLIGQKGKTLSAGDTFIVNNPYLGGTHLPDVTAISPVFFENSKQADFFVASRGHHSDIGGITPGSMPPKSKIIQEEGIIFSHFHLTKVGKFFEQELRETLRNSEYPARNPDQNVFDLIAQVAANNTGIEALKRLCNRYGQKTVEAYMQFVRDNAASSVRKALSLIKDGQFETALDDGSKIAVKIKIDRHSNNATIDFHGTSAQHSGNMNAPLAISKAALLYVFRTIVKDNIPLNDGCIAPISFSIPEGSLLNPIYPAAVVAGNVETSQLLVDCLYGAMDIMSASQGTMNNLTFGDEQFQYYETICGGSGAGPGFNGASAVHTHMTNSRLTDPEILELRYPVIVKNFEIRKGSGGEGTYKGGDGVVRCIQFRTPMTVSILSQRRRQGAFGLHGGKSGQAGRNLHIKENGETVDLPGTASIQVKPGDCIQIETPGGGGWGG